MSLSNSTTFNPNVVQIVSGALNLLGVLSVEDSLIASDYNTGLFWLNMLIKFWQAKQIGLWTERENILFLTSGQSYYRLGGAVPDAAADHWLVTTLATQSNAGSLTLAITETIDPTDRFSAVQDGWMMVMPGANTNGSNFSTPVTGISGNTISIGVTTPSTVSAGAPIYFYDTTITRPVMVKNVRYRMPSNIDIPTTELSRMDYDQTIGLKTLTTSIVTSYYYEIKETDAILHVWPVPNSTGILGQVRFTAIRRLDDFINTTDTADMPQEWLLPLTYNLALIMAPAYNKELKVNTQGPGSIAALAQMTLDTVKKFDSEVAPTFIVPNIGE